jgi:nicotinamide phosphoribosyltransferase
MGAGSMSMMALVCADDEGTLQFAGKWNGTNAGPYTRDTFGIAVKATYAEDQYGNGINIFKRPKALTWKKSQKGCCIVAMDGESYTDEHGFNETLNPDVENLLKVVFVNGQVVRRQSLAEIRERLWG